MDKLFWELLHRRHKHTLMCYDNFIAIMSHKPVSYPEIETQPKAIYDLKTDTITWLGELSNG